MDSAAQNQPSEINDSVTNGPSDAATAPETAAEPPSKKARLEDGPASNGQANSEPPRRRGIAPVKPEYVMHRVHDYDIFLLDPRANL